VRLFGYEIRRAGEQPAAIGHNGGPPLEERAIQITQNASRDEILAFYGLDGARLPTVSRHSALRVPAFAAAVLFLSRTLATLDLGAWRKAKEGPAAIGGRLGVIVSEAPNPEWSSYQARVSFWQDVFSSRVGRGIMIIVRVNGQPYELWPVRADAVMVSIDAYGHRTYTVTGGREGIITRTYDAADVIDVPFMLSDDMCTSTGPLNLGEKALQLAIAMGDYGANFFAGGGVPPLALVGPLPEGRDGITRAMNDVGRAIDVARKSDKPIIPLPAGHELKPIGFDPAKGQMTDARRLQIEEIARVFQLPPVFLQDLSKATFSNAEQQDLHLVKHLVGQWATALEQEMNLKLFGQMRNGRYVRHNLDSLMRGDFKTRIEGLARGVQTALLTPNEGRALDGRPAKPHGDDLLIQGATVPLGTPPSAQPAPATPNNGDAVDGNASDATDA